MSAAPILRLVPHATPAPVPRGALTLAEAHQLVSELRLAGRMPPASAPPPPPPPPASIVSSGGITVERVRAVVADFFHIRQCDLARPSKSPKVTEPRALAMLLCRELTRASLPQIGRAFERDHSTVISACRRIRERLVSDPVLAGQARYLRLRLQAEAPSAAEVSQ